MKKGNKLLTFGRIILKDPWSRLASKAEVSAFWDRYWWSELLESYAIWIKEPYGNLKTRGGWGIRHSFPYFCFQIRMTQKRDWDSMVWRNRNCCCCCNCCRCSEWSLGKIKPLLGGIVVRRVEREGGRCYNIVFVSSGELGWWTTPECCNRTH